MKKLIFDEEEFIANYQELKSSRKMAELYKCSKGAILKFAKEINYDNNHNKDNKLEKYTKEEIINKFKELNSLKETANYFNCSSTAIANYFNKIDFDYKYFIEKLSILNNKEQFIKDYNELQDTKKMAEKYECSTTTILNYLKKFNIPIYNNFKLTQQDKEYIIKHYEDKTSNELADIFKVSRGMITKIWYDNHLIGKEVIKPKTTAIDITNQRFGMLTALYPTEKRSFNGSIIWKCRCDCGNIKEVGVNDLRSGIINNCGKHYMSKGNLKIQQLLTQANISFEAEKKFDTCIDKKELPFDFYVNKQYIIEFDGKQHFYYSNDYWNTKEKYEITKKHDEIKNKWCKDNGIPIIRIPYYKLDNLTIEDLLLETTNYLLR